MVSSGDQRKEIAMTKSWRDVLPVHPAADLFPLMSEAELRELGKSIQTKGLNYQIVLWRDPGKGDGKKPAEFFLLDGRNRLDALELIGVPFELVWEHPKGRSGYWGLKS